MVKGRFISYFKACKMISKFCIYHIVRVRDEDLFGIPPKRGIDLGIDLYADTRPISISPFRMAPSQLKELKNQLKDLLE